MAQDGWAWVQSVVKPQEAAQNGVLVNTHTRFIQQPQAAPEDGPEHHQKIGDAEDRAEADAV